jgi:threonine synthase
MHSKPGVRQGAADVVVGTLMNGSREAPGATIGVIERYRAHLPVTEATPVVSLSEGSTPLIYSPRLSAIVGRGCRVYLKHEGLNPTGSFKDRGMTVAVSKAVELGSRLVVCASTGNTSASAAAYAARAGIQCAVLLPSGMIAMGKLAQAFVYGAVVIALDGNFDQCLKLVRELSSEPGISVVNSINAYRLEGQKTAAFEIVDALGDAPHLHLLPVGNAGNTTAYWRGYLEYHRLNRATRLPRMLGFEAAGAAPIFYDRVIEHPETAASAIRIGNPASWNLANAAFQESGGAIEIVTDEEIFAAQSWLASKEGLFVEPASAASVAGLFKCRTQTASASSPVPKIPDDAIVVCTLTGHGLKDTAAVLNDSVRPLSAQANKAAILSILEKAK